MGPLLNQNLRALSLIGLWESPKKSRKLNFVFRFYGLFLWVWFATFTTTQFMELFFIGKDYKLLIENAGVTILYIIGVAKTSLLVFKNGKLKELVKVVNKTENEIIEDGDEWKIELLLDYCRKNWRKTKFYWSIAFVTIIGFFIKPKIESVLLGKIIIMDEKNQTSLVYRRLLIFSSWVPYDKYSDGLYELTYVIQTFTGSVAALHIVIWDTFIVSMIVHAIGQLIILQDSLRNLGKRKKFNEEDIYKEVVQCIKHHYYIIEYIKNLDVIISPVMFSEFMACSLMLCAIGFQIISEGPTVGSFFTFEYLLSMLIQLSMFYWHGNEMILESLQVSYAVWESNWSKFTNRTRNALALIMMRSQRPLGLNIGYFYTMSLETYLLILRASYSYIALLRQLLK